MKKNDFKVVIIGSGFSGLCTAMKLLKEGIEDFVILEKNDTIGGTWTTNKYPGCEVDVPSHLYSFSFEPYDWPKFYSNRESLNEYTNFLIDKYSIKSKTKLNFTVEKIEYSENSKTWSINGNNSEKIASQFVVCSPGRQNIPNIPKFNGLETYSGNAFHTSNWDNNLRIKNKKVGLIGVGASAIQIIPEIVDDCQNLHVFKRNPKWVLPKKNKEYPVWQRKLFLKIPITRKFYRNLLFINSEYRVLGFRFFPKILKLYEKKAIGILKKKIDSPELVNSFIPNYPLGSCRVLLGTDFLSDLNKENVFVENGRDISFYEKGIISENKKIELDIIIFATGFKNTKQYISYDIFGIGGQSLKTLWEKRAKAYLGMFVNNCPNLFLTIGPNSLSGTNSELYTIEKQTGLIVDLIVNSKTDKTTINVKKEVVENYTNGIDKKINGTVWDCNFKHWYHDNEGNNDSLFPSFSTELKYLITKVKNTDFE